MAAALRSFQSSPPPSSPSLLLSEAASALKRLLLEGCRSARESRPIHARLLRLGLAGDSSLLNSLLRSYFASDNPADASRLFRHHSNEAGNDNVFLWNTMIRGLVSVDRMDDAVQHYIGMRKAGVLPDNFTYPFVLKACARLQDLVNGARIHANVIKAGFELDVFVKTGLLSMYAKCGCLDDAQVLFDGMPVKNVVSWTAIISAYIAEERFKEALCMFRKSLELGLLPDSFTLVRVLTACSQLGDSKTGEWINRLIDEKGMNKNVFVATSLIDMYTKCGNMEKARLVFDGIIEKDVVAWSAMIGGYSSNGFPREALELFFQMQATGMKPDCFTMVGVLSACARMGALELGQQVSHLMEMSDFLKNAVLGTALIDMYAKCGSTSWAWDVFVRMIDRDLIVWNAMISCLSMTSHGKLSFGLFAQLEKLGFTPDGNTFIGLLCGCTHTGLVEDGQQYFRSMTRVYCITPRIEHYGCMVDLLCRAGLLKEAYELIKMMPMEANAVVWGAMLGGCRMYRDSELAQHVLKKLIELEPLNSGNYVLLSNIYATSGRWEESAKLREVMKEKRIQKTPGCSWVEIKGIVHEFHVGDKSHPLSEQIYLKLDELSKKLKLMGYVPTTEVVLFDVEEEEKEHSLGYHSEKLAIAFGLIALQPEDTIRVVKNLRVCNDCHVAIKVISKITCREIIVRDNNRFHCFRDGSCSCNDYW